MTTSVFSWVEVLLIVWATMVLSYVFGALRELCADLRDLKLWQKIATLGLVIIWPITLGILEPIVRFRRTRRARTERLARNAARESKSE